MSYAVITICRNAAATIARSIRSVQAQTVPPAQYIIVDGESTDGTLEVVAELAEGMPSGCDFQVVPQPPPPPGVAGIPNAWNLGLGHIHANIIFLLNADDWLEPDAAETVLAAFAEAPEAGLLTSPIRIVADDRQWLLRPRPLWLFPFLMPVMHPGCFVRRWVYDRVGDFDERYRISADYDFAYRCCRAGIPFHSLSRPLVNMQWGGAARQNLPTARRETLEIARRHCRVPGLPFLAYALRRMLGR